MAENDKEPKAEEAFEGIESQAFNNGIEIEKPAAKADTEADKTAAKDDATEEDVDGKSSEEADESGADEVAKEPAKKEDMEEDSEEEEEAPPPKKKLSAEDRIRQLTKQRRTAERERDEARRERDEAKRPAASAEDEQDDLTAEGEADKEGKRPDPKDYQYGQLDDKYLADVIAYGVNKALAQERAKNEKTRQEQAASDEAQKFGDKLQKLHTAGSADETLKDFDEVVVEAGKAGDYDLSQLTLELCADSDVGAKVLYHLATNPQEATRIYKLQPAQQAAAFGRLEAKFSAPAAKAPKPPREEIPPPIKQPRGAGGKFAITPETSDFEAFERLANSDLKKDR